MTDTIEKKHAKVHTLQLNRIKLEKRYKCLQYSDEAAQARADKDV